MFRIIFKGISSQHHGDFLEFIFNGNFIDCAEGIKYGYKVIQIFVPTTRKVRFAYEWPSSNRVSATVSYCLHRLYHVCACLTSIHLYGSYGLFFGTLLSSCHQLLSRSSLSSFKPSLSLGGISHG